MTSNQLSKDYNKILKAWDKGDYHNDIYHMILDLCNKYTELQDIDEVQEILERMSNNESSQDIVEDFIYGDKYSRLREKLN